jgi:hypothetical protein
VDVKYALNNAATGISLVRTNNYKGNIGLSAWNPSGYAEYRQRFLDLPNTTTTGTQVCEIGEQNSPIPPTGRTFLDFGTNDGTSLDLIVHDAPARGGTDDFAVQVIRGVELELTVHSGGVCVGNDLANATNTTLLLVKTWNDANVYIGPKTTLMDAGEVFCVGGTLVVDCEAASGANTWVNEGGTLSFNATTTASLEARGGTTYYGGGDLNTATIYSGATFSEWLLAGTLNSVSMFRGSTFNNRGGRLSLVSTIQLSGCSLTDVKILHPDGQEVTLA